MKMTIEDIERFLDAHFPQAKAFGRIEHIGDRTLRMRVPFRDEFLRPGGTVSGPTLMGLADTAVYYLILAELGPIALAVTSSFNINFLRKPRAADLIGEARLLRLGRRTAVGDVMIFVDGESDPVAHATAAYALPERPR